MFSVFAQSMRGTESLTYSELLAKFKDAYPDLIAPTRFDTVYPFSTELLPEANILIGQSKPHYLLIKKNEAGAITIW